MRRIILLFAIVLCTHTLYSQTVSEIVASLDDKLALMHDEESRRNLYESKEIDISQDNDAEYGPSKTMYTHYENGVEDIKYVSVEDGEWNDCGFVGYSSDVYFDENKKFFYIAFYDLEYFPWLKKGTLYKIYYKDDNPIYCTMTNWNVEGTGNQDEDDKLIEETQVTLEKDVSEIPAEKIEEHLNLIQKYVFGKN